MWNWLNGRKRTIALIYWTIIVPSLMVIWPAGIPSNINKVVTIVGFILGAVGLGHAAIKQYQSGKNVEEIEEPKIETPKIEEQKQDLPPTVINN